MKLEEKDRSALQADVDRIQFSFPRILRPRVLAHAIVGVRSVAMYKDALGKNGEEDNR